MDADADARMADVGIGQHEEGAVVGGEGDADKQIGGDGGCVANEELSVTSEKKESHTKPRTRRTKSDEVETDASTAASVHERPGEDEEVVGICAGARTIASRPPDGAPYVASASR